MRASNSGTRKQTSSSKTTTTTSSSFDKFEQQLASVSGTTSNKPLLSGSPEKYDASKATLSSMLEKLELEVTSTSTRPAWNRSPGKSDSPPRPSSPGNCNKSDSGRTSPNKLIASASGFFTGMRTKPWTIIGKTVIITGANSGIGRVTALNLAKKGAGRIILACRNLESGEEAAAEIRSQLIEDEATSNNKSAATKTEIVVKRLDLSSLESVREFANDILASEPRLDVLVNNGGILQKENLRQTSVDGFELTFATNFLGHFLLTMMLLDLMKKSAPGRIIFVSSQAYQAAWPEGYAVDDVNQVEYQRRHSGQFSYWRAYSQSKLAMILFARYLHRHLNGTDTNSGISVFSLHPGEIRTNITRNHPSPMNFIRFYISLWGQDLKDGGSVPTYLASEPGVEKYSGKYFSKNCKAESVFKFAKDEAKAEQLVAKCLEWTALPTNNK